MKHSRFSSLFNLYSRFGFRNVPGVSLYSTATDPTYHHRKCWNGALNNLYGRISRVGDRNACILPILDEWIEEGGNAEKDDLVTIIKELRQFKYYKHALEVGTNFCLVAQKVWKWNSFRVFIWFCIFNLSNIMFNSVKLNCEWIEIQIML